MVVRITPLLLAVACPPRSSGAIDASVRSLGGGAGVGQSESGHAAALQEMGWTSHSFVFFSLRSREAADNVSGRRATSAHFLPFRHPYVFSRAQRLKPHLLERDPAVPKLKEIAVLE